MFTSTIRVVDLDRGMIVGDFFGAALGISVTADLLGFLHTTVSRVYSEWCEKRKKKNPVSRQKCHVDKRGQQRIARLVRGDRKATVTQITALYNCGEQKGITERTEVEP